MDKQSTEEKKIIISKEFIQELEYLKQESDIKRDLFAIDLLENLLKDQDFLRGV